MMDGTAFLISKIYKGKDSIGQAITETAKREIFVTERSIGRNEFFAAGKSGLRPEMYLTTSEYNYGGEKELIYNGLTYSIYRTFHADDSDEIDLYIEKKVGNVDGEL